MNKVLIPTLMFLICISTNADNLVVTTGHVLNTKKSLGISKEGKQMASKIISKEFIVAQAMLCQETINKKEPDIDTIVRLAKKALDIATKQEKNGLLYTISSHSIFSRFSDNLNNMEKLPGYSDLEKYPENDDEWEETQLNNDFKEFLVFDKNETAIDAIQRYFHFTTILQKKANEAYIENQIVFFAPPVNTKDVEIFEQTNGIMLPKAYIDFITTMGFFSFGHGWTKTELIPIDKIKKKNIIGDLNIPFEVSGNQNFFGYKVKDFENGLLIFEKPQDNYRSYEIGFFLPTHRNKQGELLFINGDHDGFEEYSNFDIYIQKMVNSRIVNSLEY